MSRDHCPLSRGDRCQPSEAGRAEAGLSGPVGRQRIWSTSSPAGLRLGPEERQADRTGCAGQSEEALGLALPPVRSDPGESLLHRHRTFLGCKVKGLIPHSSGAFHLQANKKRRQARTPRQSEEERTGANICGPTFTAAMVTMARWKQCKCPRWMHGSAQCGRHE